MSRSPLISSDGVPSIDKDTAAYVKFVKAQPVRDVMEEKVNAVVMYASRSPDQRS